MFRNIWLAIIFPNFPHVQNDLMNCDSFVLPELRMHFVKLLPTYITKVWIRWEFSDDIEVWILIPQLPCTLYSWFPIQLLSTISIDVGDVLRVIGSFFGKSFLLGILVVGKVTFWYWEAAWFEGISPSDDKISWNVISYCLTVVVVLNLGFSSTILSPSMILESWIPHSFSLLRLPSVFAHSDCATGQRIAGVL